MIRLEHLITLIFADCFIPSLRACSAISSGNCHTFQGIAGQARNDGEIKCNDGEIKRNDGEIKSAKIIKISVISGSDRTKNILLCLERGIIQ